METWQYWWANDFQGPLLHAVELLEVRICRASPDQGSILHDWSHKAFADRKPAPGINNTRGFSQQSDSLFGSDDNATDVVKVWKRSVKRYLEELMGGFFLYDSAVKYERERANAGPVSVDYQGLRLRGFELIPPFFTPCLQSIACQLEAVTGWL